MNLLKNFWLERVEKKKQDANKDKKIKGIVDNVIKYIKAKRAKV